MIEDKSTEKCPKQEKVARPLVLHLASELATAGPQEAGILLIRFDQTMLDNPHTTMIQIASNPLDNRGKLCLLIYVHISLVFCQPIF